MATCKDCIHEKVCDSLIKRGCPYLDEKMPANVFCLEFKNKADVAEVVHNNCTKQSNGYHVYIKCTCGCEMNVESYYWNLLNRCPNCGAKMDGKKVE